MTKQVLTNLKKKVSDADDLDGIETLDEEDQEKIRKAWEVGHVDDADIPDSARKPAEDEASSKKKKAGAKVHCTPVYFVIWAYIFPLISL